MDDLIQFGYTESEAAKALIRANNDFNLALDEENEDSEVYEETTDMATSSNYVEEEVLKQVTVRKWIFI